MRTLPLLGVMLAFVVGAEARTNLPKPKHGIQMRVGAYVTQPNQELEVGEPQRVPITKPMDVRAFTLSMPNGAHHFAMWGYGGALTDDGAFPQGPQPSIGCTGFTPDDAFPQLIIPTQSPNAQLRFPHGVALRLEPHQQVLLNPHMRNFGTEPLTPDIRVNLLRAPKGKIRHYAEGLTFGNMYGIHIPAGGEQTITAEWTAPINLTVIYLSTHQHRLGTYSRIDLVPPTGGTPEKTVETFDWQHPSSTSPPGGIRLLKGQKMRITCTWNNTEAHDVQFGTKTTDEMCFAIGFYYRDTGDTEPAVGGGCLPTKKGLLCPLAPLVNG